MFPVTIWSDRLPSITRWVNISQPLACAAFAISETQKFGHVTFFWNGNRSGYVDESLETYIEIPSDNVPFDQAPAMKAAEITDATIELLRNGQFDWGRINYANGDMVGHTGDLAATIESMEVLDDALARLIEVVVDELDGVVIFTADHGNADIMYTEKDGVRSPKTSHTLERRAVRGHCQHPERYRLCRPRRRRPSQHRRHRDQPVGLRTTGRLSTQPVNRSLTTTRSLPATCGGCHRAGLRFRLRLRRPATQGLPWNYPNGHHDYQRKRSTRPL